MWLKFLELLLSLSVSISAHLREKRLIGAGEAKAISRGLKNAQTAILKSKQARLDAESEFDKSGGLPDNNDPNLRD